jgi:hypothetical protein
MSTKTRSKDTPQFKLIDSAAFDELDCRHDWLVKDVLVKGEPGVIGGPKKVLKTSIMLELAISLGTGLPFLGRFAVPKQRRIAVFSGESGKATLQATARRICRSKDLKLADCQVDWEFSLPQFTSAEDRRALRAALRAARTEVVFIDPLYLCLGGSSISASNMYEVGPALATLSKICLDAGATPILIHHATKAASKIPKTGAQPMDLEDLAFAGIGEFARQWLLVNRKLPYALGSGRHSLLMSIGGSAGHSSCWDLRIEEGNTAAALSKRSWKVIVSPAVFERHEQRNGMGKVCG